MISGLYECRFCKLRFRKEVTDYKIDEALICEHDCIDVLLGRQIKIKGIADLIYTEDKE